MHAEFKIQIVFNIFLPFVLFPLMDSLDLIAAINGIVHEVSVAVNRLQLIHYKLIDGFVEIYFSDNVQH